MKEEDRKYFARRAEEEARRAEAAKPEAARVHQELARAYAARADGAPLGDTEPPPQDEPAA